jgi:hypothetical protein
MKLENSAEARWSTRESDTLDVKVEELQTIISHKGKKIYSYLRVCDSVWLLIIADGKYPSSKAEVTEAVKEHVFLTGFERVLLYSRLDGTAIALRTSC